MAAATKDYEYACPKTHRKVPLKLSEADWWENVQAQPHGAVTVQPEQPK